MTTTLIYKSINQVVIIPSPYSKANEMQKYMLMEVRLYE